MALGGMQWWRENIIKGETKNWKEGSEVAEGETETDREPKSDTERQVWIEPQIETTTKRPGESKPVGESNKAEREGWGERWLVTLYTSDARSKRS